MGVVSVKLSLNGTIRRNAEGVGARKHDPELVEKFDQLAIELLLRRFFLTIFCHHPPPERSL